MTARRRERTSSENVLFVPSPPKPKRKPSREFVPAVWDDVWDRWIQGMLVPLILSLTAAGMVIRDYAIFPGRFRWAVYHGLDARLLALSVLGVALVCHVRGFWPRQHHLAMYHEPAQTLSVFLIVLGIAGLLLHQGYLIFQ